jgi:hypothetical protein
MKNFPDIRRESPCDEALLDNHHGVPPYPYGNEK